MTHKRFINVIQQMFYNFHAWTNFNKYLEIERNCCYDSYKSIQTCTPQIGILTIL